MSHQNVHTQPLPASGEVRPVISHACLYVSEVTVSIQGVASILLPVETGGTPNPFPGYSDIKSHLLFRGTEHLLSLAIETVFGKHSKKGGPTPSLVEKHCLLAQDSFHPLIPIFCISKMIEMSVLILLGDTEEQDKK